MNGIKTTMLLAALTALFMALGYTLGGSGGAVSIVPGLSCRGGTWAAACG